MTTVKTFPILAVLALLISACAPAATPAPTADAQATISALSETMVAETLTAAPSATSAPSATPSPIPATATPAATATSSQTPTETATLTPEASPTLFQGTLAPNGLPNDGHVGWIVLSNETDLKELKSGAITLNGITAVGEKPIYFSYAFTRILKFYLPFGTYKYYITVGPKKSYRGEFRINNWDKTMIVIRNDQLLVRGP